MGTCVLGDCEVFETVAGAASQRDPAEALELEGLDARGGDLERAAVGTDDIEPAPFEQGQREDHLAGALAPKQREVGEVRACGDGAVDHGVMEHGAYDLKHAEPVERAPRGRARHREPPQPQLLESRRVRDAVELAVQVDGGVDAEFEDPQRGAPGREPMRQQGDGEGAVDDELLEARGGGDHPADGLVGGRHRLGSAAAGLEGASGEVERGEVGHAVAPAAGDAGAGGDVAGVAHLREDVLDDAVRERLHADALHPWRRRGRGAADRVGMGVGEGSSVRWVSI